MYKYENLKTDGEEFFAAANSGKGFVSFYNKVFNGDTLERRYLIKGGPGTGKSTFMKRVSDRAQSLGMSVERYRCSSDPTSLDGIIVNNSIAVIDSTAPHTEEAELVGTRDVLVDLGAFWNSEGLYREREKIKSFTQKKKRAYSLAYRFLSSAMQSNNASRELLIPYVDKKRLARLAKRLTKGISSDGGYECKIGLYKAIGMSGGCTLGTYEKIAQKTVYIEEHYGIGYLALCAICEEARQKGCKIRISYDPLSPDFLDAVFFEESKTLFSVCEPRRRGAISLRRVLDLSSLSKREKNEIKAKSRNAKKLSEALILAALDELKNAGEAHFELERIYRSNMDFSSLEVYTSQLCEDIIDFLKNS